MINDKNFVGIFPGNTLKFILWEKWTRAKYLFYLCIVQKPLWMTFSIFSTVLMKNKTWKTITQTIQHFITDKSLYMYNKQIWLNLACLVLNIKFWLPHPTILLDITSYVYDFFILGFSSSKQDRKKMCGFFCGSNPSWPWNWIA